MKKIYDLRDLFSEQLKELHNAEKQQIIALKKMIKKTETDELKNLNQKISEKTEHHVKRLEDILEMLEEDKKIIESKAMKELLDRGFSLAKICENTEVMEAALITSIQSVKHFEIGIYGTLISFANLLEQKGIADILKKTLAEEKELDKELTELAEKSINVRAKELATVTD